MPTADTVTANCYYHTAVAILVQILPYVH
jgi:hypothetical protein